jgi:hypothetical protein
VHVRLKYMLDPLICKLSKEEHVRYYESTFECLFFLGNFLRQVQEAVVRRGSHQRLLLQLHVPDYAEHANECQVIVGRRPDAI